VTAGEFRLRPGAPWDLAAVARIERESFADPWPDAALLQELVPSALRLPLVLEAAGEVVGYLMAWRTVGELHILNVAVAPSHRRQGLGRRLVDAALDEARRLGLGAVTLEVRPGNTAALALYRELGFVQTGRRPRYYADTGEDALVLTCELAAESS
jgi:ribosomal-protein-alanine N-acetyltransferase